MSRFKKIAGGILHMFALDGDGRVWVRLDTYGEKWKRLAQPGGNTPVFSIVDLYFHITNDGQDGSLRVLNDSGQTFQLRETIGRGWVWDIWPPLDREPPDEGINQ